MDRKEFLFTERDIHKLMLLCLIGALAFGLSGILIILFFQWVVRNTYSTMESEKHGISHTGASRFGGLSVALVSVTIVFVGYLNDLLSSYDHNILGHSWVSIAAVMSCMLLGMIDDIERDLLSPKTRLMVELMIFGILFSLMPNLIPSNLGIPVLDTIMSIPVLNLFILVLFCAGFINAVNMADGANGLIGGTVFVAFGVFHLIADSFLYAALMTSCALFTIFNLISGRLLLGDAGSLGLATASLVASLYMHKSELLSVGFLACLFMYPCFDFLVTLIRRRLSGRAITLPDNDHLHNRIHYFLIRRVKSKTLANSVTGLFIVSFSSGVTCVLFLTNFWHPTSNAWMLLFLLQSVTYVALFFITGLFKPVSQHVVSS